MDKSPWTNEIISTLRMAVAHKLTSPQIALALNNVHGLKLTKSAVISKCAKLGLLLGKNGVVNNKTGAQRCFWGPARRS